MLYVLRGFDNIRHYHIILAIFLPRKQETGNKFIRPILNIKPHCKVAICYTHQYISYFPLIDILVYSSSGLENNIFSREPNCIIKSHLQVLCIESSTFLGSLQIFEGAAGKFKGALTSRHPLISSPDHAN